MRRFLKWAGSLLGVLVLVGVGVLGWAWVKTDRGLARTYVVGDPPLVLLADPATLAHGGHLYVTRGCADCHGDQGAGKLVFDAGPVVKVVAPNITRGGRLGDMGVDQVAAAIRHGVRRDGHSVLFMPSPDFHDLSDADTAALIAYMQALPASANKPGEFEVRPLGRVMYAFGNFPLLPAEEINHAPRVRNAPAAGPTAAYGAYLAKGCTGCHDDHLAGQHVPGTPPSFADAANLTPAGPLGQWQEADFRMALRAGKRPDGTALDPFMPWPAIGKMSDEEISALWAYLQTLPPIASNKK